MTLRDREKAAASELEALDVMVSRPGEGSPESDLFNQWGICVGSHGGYAKTLKAAMRRCLKCCDIGKFWRTQYGKGELLSIFFKRVAKKHLGGL